MTWKTTTYKKTTCDGLENNELEKMKCHSLENNKLENDD